MQGLSQPVPRNRKISVSKQILSSSQGNNVSEIVRRAGLKTMGFQMPSQTKKRRLDSLATVYNNRSRLYSTVDVCDDDIVTSDDECEGQDETKRCDDLWIDVFQPMKDEDIAVNKKKVSDVRNWIQSAIDNSEKKLLVLTGPSGSGKTAAVRLIAKQLGLDVVEWENPVNQNIFETIWNEYQRKADRNGRWGIDYVPVLNAFNDFICSATRSNALKLVNSSDNRKKLVLVEDWPLLQSQSAKTTIQNILRSFLRSPHSSHPLILIISDISARNHSFPFDVPLTFASLLPLDIQAHPAVKRINFNSIAATFMTKTMTRLAATHLGRRFTGDAHHYYSAMVRWIVDSSGGDIRQAINKLQFLTVLKYQNLNISPSIASSCSSSNVSKRRKSASIESEGYSRLFDDHSMYRDEVCSIYRSCYRVLFNKRLDTVADEENMLCDDRFRRRKIELNPEDMLDASECDGQRLSMFFQANAPNFFATLEELDTALSYLSDSDMMTGTWENQGFMKDYAAIVAVRGTYFAFNNSTCYTPPLNENNKTPRIKGASVEFQTRQKMQENKATLQNGLISGWMQRYMALSDSSNVIFSDKTMLMSHLFSSHDLWTEVIPYLGICMKSRRHGPTQTIPAYIRQYFASVCSYHQRLDSSELQENDDATELIEEDPHEVIRQNDYTSWIPTNDLPLVLLDDDIVD